MISVIELNSGHHQHALLFLLTAISFIALLTFNSILLPLLTIEFQQIDKGFFNTLYFSLRVT